EGRLDGAVEEIGAGDGLGDAVEQNGALRFEQDLVQIGEQLAGGPAGTGGEAAEGIGQPGLDVGDVVEGGDPAVAGSDGEVTELAWVAAEIGSRGIDEAPQHRLERG